MQFPEFSGKGPTLCSTVDPDMFLPDPLVAGSLARANEAKKICANCPYLKECLEYAIEHNEDGVWGGTSRNERRKIKAERNRLKYEAYQRSIQQRPPVVSFPQA